MQLEVERNRERFSFVKWAMQAYKGIRLLPPGFGILHQINLEFFAPGLLSKDGAYYPDTLVGTDSHTGMIAGLGTVGWGVGGIEAQAAVLGQPVYMLTPDVVGVHVTGELPAGVTSTDLVLHVTEMLRKAKVVGKFVEFFGEALAEADRPGPRDALQHGARVRRDGRILPGGRADARLPAPDRPHRRADRRDRGLLPAAGLFGPVRPGEVDYSQVLTLDLSTITPNVAGPKRPQDRIPLSNLKATVRDRC